MQGCAGDYAEGLPGRVAFVTGATSGFGEACVRLFAKKGMRVVAAGRRAERLEDLRRQMGDQIHPLTFDVRNRAAVEESIKTLPAEFSAVTILVNNAGLALGLEPAHEVNIDDWETMVDTNCKGVMYCTRALLPRMVEQGLGHIINIGSIAGTYPYPGGNVYGATKAFVRQFSLNLRADLLGTGIRVTNIEPGMAQTEFSLVRFEGDSERAANVYAGMKPLTAEDIAETVLWCVERPAHVNINSVELMPTAQAFGALAVKREANS